MCGQLSCGTDELLLDWFQDCAVNTIIRKCIMSRIYYDDADIALTVPLF